MLKALNALNNDKITVYGVPELLYSGMEGEFDIMGLTLLGKDLHTRFKLENYKFDMITSLLILQKMIRIMKYIHGCDIVHNDIKPDNILLFGCELIIIGKNLVLILLFFFLLKQ